LDVLYILADTSIWLDLAKNLNGEQLIAAMRVLIHQRHVELLVPKVVITEFEHNRERIESAMTRSISSDLRQARFAIDLNGRARGRKAAIDLLDDVTHRVPLMNQMATRFFDEILDLLRTGRELEVTSDVNGLAVQRALEKRAPFHHGKNSIADALLIELYSCWVAGLPSDKGNQSCFVTANTKDFSIPYGDTRQPHPDFANAFGPESRYFTSLGAAILASFPVEGAELLDELDFRDEPRHLDEIKPVVDKLWDQISYNRHLKRLFGSEFKAGESVESVTPERYSEIERHVLEMADPATRQLEAKWGSESSGPWDDFEWGIMNGKMSALNWVLGSDWESSLDT
jgi:hypothetical protein